MVWNYYGKSQTSYARMTESYPPQTQMPLANVGQVATQRATLSQSQQQIETRYMQAEHLNCFFPRQY